MLFATQHIQSQPSQQIDTIVHQATESFNFETFDLSYKGNNYRIYTASPKKKTKTNSPILYMLDGNGMFPKLINLVYTNPNNAIIIAIGYPNELAYPKERTRDYTITSKEDNQSNGGAPQFSEFITYSLKPLVEKKYNNIDTMQQTLAGHSFGGLFTLYELFNHTVNFQNYVVASPSLWWADGAIIPSKQPILASIPNSITITQGEYEAYPDRETDVKRKERNRKDIKSSNKDEYIITTLDLSMLIKEECPDTNYILFDGKNHGTSVTDYLEVAYKVAGGE